MNDETLSVHIYEVRPRKDKRAFDPVSNALPFGRLWYGEVSDAIDYAKFFSRSHDSMLRKRTAVDGPLEESLIVFSINV